MTHMTNKTLIAFAVAVLSLSNIGCSGHEESHDSHESHAAHTAPTESPTLPAGQLWPTDAPLREAMSRIRTAIETNVHAHENEQVSAADATTLATAIEEDVNFMIKNCKLEPQSDAALHALIGRMLNAAASLKNDPASDAGVPQLLAVLHDYQATFDHPGWDTGTQLPK
jgi:hypothetical protein